MWISEINFTSKVLILRYDIYIYLQYEICRLIDIQPFLCDIINNMFAIVVANVKHYNLIEL
jgi:hypothetical protein